MKSKRKNSGFTLVELIVVICAVSILSAFLIPSFIAQREDARSAYDEAKANAMSIAFKRSTSEDEVQIELDQWLKDIPVEDRTVTIRFAIDSKGKLNIADAKIEANGIEYDYKNSKIGLNSYQEIGTDVQFQSSDHYGKIICFTLSPKTTKTTAECTYSFE